MRKLLTLVVLLIVGFLLVVQFSPSLTRGEEATSGDRHTGPEFTGISAWLNSPPLTLEGLRGKVVLVQFWTYSCINCVRTLPYVTKWYDTYNKDNAMVNVIAARTGGDAGLLISGQQAMGIYGEWNTGGAYLSVGFTHSFNENMTEGRGFIALAALIFGKWRPFGAFAAALLFGFSTALAYAIPPAYSDSASSVLRSSALIQALPYLLTLIAVAGVIGRSIPPAAVGRPYKRQ